MIRCFLENNECFEFFNDEQSQRTTNTNSLILKEKKNR